MLLNILNNYNINTIFEIIVPQTFDRLLQSSDEHQIPLRFTDPELEAILFPDLFPDGHGYYGEISNRSSSLKNDALTYGKYI